MQWIWVKLKTTSSYFPRQALPHWKTADSCGLCVREVVWDLLLTSWRPCLCSVGGKYFLNSRSGGYCATWSSWKLLSEPSPPRSPWWCCPTLGMEGNLAYVCYLWHVYIPINPLHTDKKSSETQHHRSLVRTKRLIMYVSVLTTVRRQLIISLFISVWFSLIFMPLLLFLRQKRIILNISRCKGALSLDLRHIYMHG